jgi:hypothetical protein
MPGMAGWIAGRICLCLDDDSSNFATAGKIQNQAAADELLGNNDRGLLIE